MPARDAPIIPAELLPPYTVTEPERQVAPFVFCSPHSGRIYPQSFIAQSRLTPLCLRKSEDCFVDELIAPVAELGVPLISARFPRAFLDVNREPYEFDPEIFDEPLPDYANTQSVRVAGGLGTIARIVADGEEIYRHKISLADALARVQQLYIPFHAALCELVETTRQRFGYAILIDCHSMPSSSMASFGGPRPDIVLGDRFGASADNKISRFLRDTLTNLGYKVHMNRPYAGGYITEHYGRPARNVHAVQIEINRGLYIDERTLRLKKSFATLQRDLQTLAGPLLNELPAMLEYRAAAE
ncbi:N-formylglutamate deformylase [Hyphomicrobium sulfonivorans]|uniref:N-formylglutamate deformylase n=1 Tax=Hyphomicrobium sulfonivorans TaxID=121290 RepID=A0A109BNL4_HYPSL|nr:N-formylglutamate amidohydrolase [Hyphomicrobium sulfonivorans]KWT71282.1 N-formylglutamate deformylase [Hyphomicrobium sulfonivorans]